MKSKPKYRLRVRITPLAMCAILAVSMAACKTAQAAGSTEVTTQIAAESGTALEGTQVIELTAYSNELPSDELPSDEPETATASDELPSDELPSDDAATEVPTIYEADFEGVAPATYNGISEGDVISGTLTYYDVCISCCGKTDGVTASGLYITNGMENPFIVSLNWLPLGSIIEVDGVQYTVADRGGDNLSTVGRADVFTPEGHQRALELGRTECEIKIVKIAEG